MRRILAATASLSAVAALCGPAAAAPALVAVGSINQAFDLSGRPELLENGVDHQNTFGGIGSGLAWAGGSTFLSVPDRGPNATAYAPGVDDTTSYIQRFHTYDMALSPATAGSLPYALTPTLTGTTLLYSATSLNYGATAGLPAGNAVNPASGAPPYYFTGRSDGFAGTGSGNPQNARLDTEAIRVSPDGRSVFVSDEYGPDLYQFDRSTGQRIRTITLPDNLLATQLRPQATQENAANTTGRTANRGMEGLAITPDGKTLVGMVQSALRQDPGGLARIVVIDIATGRTLKEIGYPLSASPGASEIVAINNDEFLVLERDSTGNGDVNGPAADKKLFRINIAGATDITTLSGDAALAQAVTKTPVVDLVAVLNAAGIPLSQVPSKLEGLTFGPDIQVPAGGGTVSEHTLWVSNDNDFLPNFSGPGTNPNQFFVIGVTDADLGATYVAAAQAVPEPGSAAVLLAGMLGLAGLVRRSRSGA